MSYVRLRNGVSGPELGLAGRMSAGFKSEKPHTLTGDCSSKARAHTWIKHVLSDAHDSNDV